REEPARRGDQDPARVLLSCEMPERRHGLRGKWALGRRTLAHMIVDEHVSPEAAEVAKASGMQEVRQIGGPIARKRPVALEFEDLLAVEKSPDAQEMVVARVGVQGPIAASRRARRRPPAT